MGAANFSFFKGVPSGDPTVDSMLDGSGGNAIQAAISLCANVDVFGVGLLSQRWDEDKAYAHYWDGAAGVCAASKAPFRAVAMHRPLGWRTLPAWRDARLGSELLLHLLHAFGVIRWR